MGKEEPTFSSHLARAPTTANVYVIRKHRRAFAVYDPSGMLVCVVLYLKGAREVVR